MKNLIVIGVVTIAVVGVIGFAAKYFDWSQVRNLRASGSDLLRQVQPDKSTTETGNPNLAENAGYRDWSMFTNDEYRLTLRYPSDLTVNASGVQLLTDQNPKTLVQLIKHGTANSRGTSITVQVQNIGEKTLDQFTAEFNRGTVLLKKETTIDGVRSLRLWVRSPLEENDQLQEDYILVKKGDNLFTFSSAGDENRSLFERIIDTVTLVY